MSRDWRKWGHELDLAVGIAQNYAAIGNIGFEGRFQYSAISGVANLASRLCGEARAGQILVGQRVYTAVEALATVEPVGDLQLKGFVKPVRAYNIVSLKDGA
jgi:class 3 adenylate cyclase